MSDYRVVGVKWYDASFQEGECTKEELVTRIEMLTVGFLVNEDEHTISIALCYCSKDNTWKYIVNIPQVNISEKSYFRNETE